jgi:hypothetical protein
MFENKGFLLFKKLTIFDLMAITDSEKQKLGYSIVVSMLVAF